nr:NADAR domain-containing protein [Cellulomonas hominis]
MSNFYRAALRIEGETYAGGEWAFNALKTLDLDQRVTVRQAATASRAKAAGQRVTLRVPKKDWDSRVRYQVMAQVVRAKFEDVTLRNSLIATRDALLIEGTGTARRAWHDQAWGQCYCDKHRAWCGGNALGLALMAERDRLRGAHRRWTRVAVTGHRPHLLDEGQAAFARAELSRLALKLKTAHHAKVAISGMSTGADAWWADTALAAGLDLWAYIPFWGQPDRWAPGQAQHWEDQVARASRRLVLGQASDVAMYHERNNFMLRDANALIAVHDPAHTSGGTASTIAKARAAGRPLILVDVVSRRTTIENPDGPASVARP